MAVIARLPAGAPGNAVISDDLKTLHAQGRTEAIYHAVVPLDGTTRTIAYRKSSAYPLYLVVGLAQEDYLVRWREQLRLAIIGLAVLTVLLLVAGTALIRLTVARKQEVTRRRAAQAETLAALNKTEAILNNASDGIHLLDVRGHLLECNDRFCQMLGYSREELLGRCVTQWDAGFNPDTLISQTLRELFKVTGARVLETRHRRRDGVVFDVEITFNTFELDGQPCLFAASRDISERKRARERLQLAASVFSHAHEGIMITDPQGIILEVNKSFTRITGYEHDEVIGQSPRILKSNRHPPQYHEALWHDLLTKGHWYGETWNRRKDGSNYVEMLNITAVKDDEGALHCYVGLFSDITAFKEHQKQLEHIAHHDALTNLPNRVLLNDRLQQAMHQTQRHKRAMAVVFLDLDGFKAVNDEHGHEAGDRLLIAVGHRLQTELREGDTLARVGGDEFVAVLSDLESPEECENVLERMLHAAARPVAMNDLSLQVTASIGATVYPQDPSDPEQLMRHADQAMYQAKQEGRNRYRLFDLVHDSALRSRREGMDSIRRALVHGELRLFHQPKVDMHTGQLIGTEALIRWQKPDGPLVLPGEFIPVLEDHPLAVEVGEWVIRTALAQMAQWHAQGLDVPVSVNVGSRQLQEPDFLERLRVLLAEQPTLPRGLLSLEILETSALEDISRTSGLMESCRELGVNFALDDFGTGYSSLAYLKLLPVSCLKIDQSFVIHLTSAPENRSIVDGIMGLARAFGREVIAEGVETVEHARQLLKLGCYRMQGFGIARPMPADELPAWATQWPQRTEWLALCDSA
jgi:diguanylate cyclase (GGDEF)-like protein/PAS domain S-box-containing protein